MGAGSTCSPRQGPPSVPCSATSVSIPWVPGRRVRPLQTTRTASADAAGVSIPWVPGRRVRPALENKLQEANEISLNPVGAGSTCSPEESERLVAKAMKSQSRGCRVDVFASLMLTPAARLAWSVSIPWVPGRRVRLRHCTRSRQGISRVSIPWVPGRRVRLARASRAAPDVRVSIPWVPGRRVRPLGLEVPEITLGHGPPLRIGCQRAPSGPCPTSRTRPIVALDLHAVKHSPAFRHPPPPVANRFLRRFPRFSTPSSPGTPPPA